MTDSRCPTGHKCTSPDRCTLTHCATLAEYLPDDYVEQLRGAHQNRAWMFGDWTCGTTTGRMSSHTPHFEELPRGNTPKPNKPATVLDHDYRHAEERVLAHMVEVAEFSHPEFGTFTVEALRAVKGDR